LGLAGRAAVPADLEPQKKKRRAMVPTGTFETLMPHDYL
jgi:hypothetical protein